MSKYFHGPFCRDTYFIVPTFDFCFKVILSKANKGKLIVERDTHGRIIKSEVPKNEFVYN